ncbi:hypothetical protein ACGF3K_14635 [Streptomyces sp. NPDC047980]|uniref:hypothetical protein n=1 Tax=Streptomyces sp. NPDC047980 TaxID=3365494 RepID=UPI0037225EC5
MATTDDYGQGVSIASLTDTPNAETLAKNIANAIVQRSVMRFSSASARAAALTSPVEGMQTWLQDTNLMYHYDGSSWVPQSTETMGWTALSSLGSYGGGVTASTPAPRMRKINDHGTEVWEYEGAVNISAMNAATTTLLFTFNAGHRPATGRGFVTYNSSHYGTRLTIATDGKLSASVPTEAGNGVNKVWLDGARITNPAAT